MNSKGEKIGLVLEGGGMKCAYGAGILDCFLEGGISFDYVIGVSAGAANGASFLAGQHGRNLRFYTDHIREPDYFGVKPLIEQGGIFGLDYIYGKLSNSGGKDPLDFDAFSSNPAEYEAVATDAMTGAATYFGKQDMSRDNYRVIMASACLPAVSKPVIVGGRPYFDGGVSDSIPCDRAFAKGCDKIVVITSKPRDFFKEPEGHKPIYTRMLKDYPQVIKALDNRHIMYRENQRKMFGYEQSGKAFLYCISRPVRVSTYNMDAGTLRKLYDLGRRDYSDTAGKLRAFIGQ